MHGERILEEIKRGKTGYGWLFEHDGHLSGKPDMINQINEDIKNHEKFVIPDRFTVSALFQRYGKENANGRIYPEAILKREVAKYIEERVNRNCAIAALDHPSSSTISLHDVTHRITNLEWDGCNLVGEMDLHLSPGYRRYGICSTSGDLAANLILDNILIGVSSRGVGSVEEKMGKLIVGDDFELIAFDIVGEPSTHNAFIKMNRDELKQYYESDETKENKPMVSEKIERIRNILC